MGDEKKKGGGFKKAVVVLVMIPVLAYAGYFAYAKTSGKEPTCLFQFLCAKFK